MWKVINLLATDFFENVTETSSETSLREIQRVSLHLSGYYDTIVV
mgnify:CR=1 FL=1